MGAGPGPLKVSADQLPTMLGFSTVRAQRQPPRLLLNDQTLA